MLFVYLKPQPLRMRNVDSPEEKHNGEHRAESRNRDEMGMGQES